LGKPPTPALPLLVLGVLVSLGGSGALPAAAEAAEVLAPVESCVQRNLPERSTRHAVRFRTVDRTGSARTSSAVIFWRAFEAGSRTLVRFSEPPDLRDSALLVIREGVRADNLIWVPELMEVRRISGRAAAGSMFGTDFSYDEFERIQGLFSDQESRRLPDAVLDDRDAFSVETRPSGAEGRYERIVSYVDQRTCVVVRVDFFESGDRLRKVMTAPRPRIQRKGSRYVPTLLLMKDLRQESYTELIVDRVELNTELPGDLFQESGLAHPDR